MLMSRWSWSVAYCHDAPLKLQRHSGKRVICIYYHIPVILIDLGNDHVFNPTLVIAVRKKTHSRLYLINTAKRFSRHSLLQRFIPFSVGFLRRQRHFKSIARSPTLERSLKGRQQTSTPVLIFQRLIAPHS